MLGTTIRFGHRLTFSFSKVTALEPGPFRTNLSQSRAAPPHPAYADPALHASQVRKHLVSTDLFNGDVSKAAVVIDKISQLNDLPIRFPLHKEIVARLRDKAKGFSEVADRYESWSDDLYHDT